MNIKDKDIQVTSLQEGRQLSLSTGYLGIADEEEWDGSTGELLISGDQISGSISEISITHSDTRCMMLMNFSGQTINHPSEENDKSDD